MIQSPSDNEQAIEPELPCPTAKTQAVVGSKLLLITCLSSIGGLMFGYDTGVVSGVLVLLQEHESQSSGFGDLSSGQLEAITSVTSLAAIAGTIAAAYASDAIGRKRVIAWSCVVFILAGIVMGLAPNFWTLILGRALAGVGIGAGSAVVPVYIGEVAPASRRGSLVTLNSVACTGGQVLAYVMGVVFQYVNHGWRYMFGVSVIPPLIFIAALGLVPESPRYLIAKGELQKAAEVAQQLGWSDDLNCAYSPAADQYRITEELEETEDGTCGFSPVSTAESSTPLRGFTPSLKSSKEPTLRKFVTHNLQPILVSCGLMAAQQLCGFNSFMYYSATIFRNIGISNPLETSIIVSVTNLAFTFVAVYYVDRVGRRAMLLRTMIVMVFALVVTGYAFLDPINIRLLLVSCIVFVASYSSALGNVPWQAVEFFAVEYRSLGSMFIANTNWICNAGVAASFLSLVNAISPAGTFMLYALITSVAYIGVYVWYPEVAGMPLEQVHQVFE